MDKFTSVADRVRTMNDEELSRTITEYCIGVVKEVLRDTGYEITPEMNAYEQVLLQQLRAPTTEVPRRLTEEEMRAMRGQMVYIHYIGPCHGFYQDGYMPYFGDEEIGITLINEGYSRLHMPLSMYNKSWCALAYKPNDTLCVLD